MSDIRDNRPELLAPAGDMECLRAALDFGADAVYLAGQMFGMRTAPSNFTREELQTAVALAHARGVRVYVTCNTVPRNKEIDLLPDYLAFLQEAGVDALIVTDLGVIDLAKRYAPKVELHVSTQAGITNYAAANAFYQLGAKRVVLARETTMEEIAEIRAKTPKDLEIEAFVHGAMCMSFSGRCLLSNYMAGRDANRGACAQPCRWKYALVEEKRPGQYMPIYQEGEGSYILNSKDMCMVRHLPELLRAGVTSLKIEGRAKSSYYVAVTTNAYRWALDELEQHPDIPVSPWIVEELDKISHRPYSTGFYLGGEPGQETVQGGYVRNYEVIAVCEDYHDGIAILSQRNRFFRGETADVLEVGEQPFDLPLDELFDQDGQPIESAPHATMTVLLKTERPLKRGAILRHRRTEDS
ncbi:peptidase U32 family protein [Anaeromassilibacillus sp. An250]|uniref:peptidase U32 family protein n=1 Tax=Anaeromassilibacillus sp. An250 TaxID=1965604 RepID=UPI000B39E0F7|nr:U32 family peptidase [Anaeromassilibacillus sp. An250]OUO75893.1 peptidase U32 [Anaeromassilibacillus sp. An250]